MLFCNAFMGFTSIIFNFDLSNICSIYCLNELYFLKFVASITSENTLNLLHLCHVLFNTIGVVGGIPRFVADGNFVINPTRRYEITTKSEGHGKKFLKIHQNSWHEGIKIWFLLVDHVVEHLLNLVQKHNHHISIPWKNNVVNFMFHPLDLVLHVV